MDEWRPVKTAVTWGATALLIVWLLGAEPNAYEFGFMGTMGLIVSIYGAEEKGEK